MGISKKSDGRYVVGKGISDSNDYNGSMGYRDIVIQLTESGATAKSVKNLEFLRDYATYHAGLREPIVPPNVQIWISGNGYSKAVEADDINITDNGFEICGIVYNGSSWDYTNAGKSSGGSGLPEVSAADNGKLLGVTDGAWGKVDAPSGGGDLFIATFEWDPDLEQFLCDKTLAEIIAAEAAGKQVFGRSGLQGPLSYAYEGSTDEHYVVNKYTFRFMGIGYYENPATFYDDVYSITADTVSEESFTSYTLTPVSP